MARWSGIRGMIGMLMMAAAMGAPHGVWAQQAPAAVNETAQATPQDLGTTQQRLMELLRVTPTLADVVSSDPSLLSDQQYVAKSNPELAAFLEQHPEIGRNPSFWLFSELRTPRQERYQILEPKRGFEPRRFEASPGSRVLDQLAPPFVTLMLLIALAWVIRTLVESRRWTKVFALQSEVHAKLIDRFATSQELLGYMETDAGRRFLEASPIVTETESRRMPNLISRMMATLQVGLVLTLLGAGLLGLRNAVGDAGTSMLVLGILALMPGIGLILSAGALWVLGRRLNLMEPPNVPADMRGRE